MAFANCGAISFTRLTIWKSKWSTCLRIEIWFTVISQPIDFVEVADDLKNMDAVVHLQTQVDHFSFEVVNLWPSPVSPESDYRLQTRSSRLNHRPFHPHGPLQTRHSAAQAPVHQCP